MDLLAWVGLEVQTVATCIRAEKRGCLSVTRVPGSFLGSRAAQVSTLRRRLEVYMPWSILFGGQPPSRLPRISTVQRTVSVMQTYRMDTVEGKLGDTVDAR